MFDFVLQIRSSSGCPNCEKLRETAQNQIRPLVKAKRSTATCQRDKMEIFYSWINTTFASVIYQTDIQTVESTEPNIQTTKAKKYQCPETFGTHHVRVYHWQKAIYTVSILFLQSYLESDKSLKWSSLWYKTFKATHEFRASYHTGHCICLCIYTKICLFTTVHWSEAVFEDGSHINTLKHQRFKKLECTAMLMYHGNSDVIIACSG